MASFKKMFVTDKTLETDGVWHPIGAGVEIKVARLGTVAYNNTLRNLAKPYKNVARRIADDDGDLTPEDVEVFRDIEAKALAKHVLVDWKGITKSDEPDSEEVPYSFETAVEYIKESDDFRKMVIELATRAANFKGAVGKN